MKTEGLSHQHGSGEEQMVHGKAYPCLNPVK